MNRFNWTYVDDSGKKNNIGIAHFPKKSGHLLIYCNSKLMVIDFSVFEDKTYSFFIEEEMCEISIEKKEGQYLYGFEINKEIDTPRNRFRKKQERQNFWKSLLFLAAFLSIILAVIYYFTASTSHTQKVIDLTAKNGLVTPAKLFFEEQSDEVKYSFIVNNVVFSDKVRKLDLAKAEEKIGLAIQSGDEFMVLYAPINPHIHQLKLDQPSDLQIQRYQSTVLSLELQNNNRIDSVSAKCMIQLAFEQKGISALADIYHQQTNPSINAIHNSDSYKRLIRDEAFKKLVNETCW